MCVYSISYKASSWLASLWMNSSDRKLAHGAVLCISAQMRKVFGHECFTPYCASITFNKPCMVRRFHMHQCMMYTPATGNSNLFLSALDMFVVVICSLMASICL